MASTYKNQVCFFAEWLQSGCHYFAEWLRRVVDRAATKKENRTLGGAENAVCVVMFGCSAGPMNGRTLKLLLWSLSLLATGT